MRAGYAAPREEAIGGDGTRATDARRAMLQVSGSGGPGRFASTPIILRFGSWVASGLVPTIPANTIIPSWHDYRIVALSVFVSLLAAYAARDLAEQVTAARGRAWVRWLAGAVAIDW